MVEGGWRGGRNKVEVEVDTQGQGWEGCYASSILRVHAADTTAVTGGIGGSVWRVRAESAGLGLGSHVPLALTLRLVVCMRY